jgi:hypothetical protein
MKNPFAAVRRATQGINVEHVSENDLDVGMIETRVGFPIPHERPNAPPFRKGAAHEIATQKSGRSRDQDTHDGRSCF